jgi:16S rRNA processing protein RimM
MSERVCVGALGGAFGVRGEVRLKSFCAVPEDIAAYGPLYAEDGRRFEVRVTGQVSNGLSARLSGVTTKEAADALRGLRLYAPREALPSLPDDEFYHADLIGLEVVDTGGTPLGRVKAVLNHGAGDILELQRPGAAGTLLLPFTIAAVPTVDIAAGRIVADPPEGLLPED